MPDTNGLSLTDWLSLIGTVGGSALASSNGRIGRPLGVGMETLGGIGLLYGQQKQQRDQQKRLAAMLYNTKDPAMQFAAPMVLSGVDLPTALKAAQDRQAGTQQQDLTREINGIPATPFRPAMTPEEAYPRLRKYESPSEAKTDVDMALGVTKPKEYEPQKFADKAGNIKWVTPGGDTTGLTPYEKPAKPEKPRVQVLTDEKGHPVGELDLDTLKTRPITGTESLYKSTAKPKEPKEWTAKDATTLVNEAEKAVKTEGTTKGWWGDRTPTGPQIRHVTVRRLAMQGYDKNGMPLKDGQTVMDESGRPMVGANGKPMIWKDDAAGK